MGALLLAVIAAMTPFVAGPDLAYAQQSTSTDTTLFQLSIDGQGGETPTVSAFMPAFVPGGAPAADGYTAYAANSVTDLTLTANASHSGASVEVKAGATEAAAKTATAIDETSAGSNQYTVDTAAGFQGADDETVILVTVTAADDVAMDTYMVTVVVGAANSNVVTLSALSLMAGGDDVTIAGTATAGEFAATDCQTAGACTALVPYSTTSVAVTAEPTDEDDGATYAVTSKNADDEDNTVQNGVVSLSEGANTVTVTVTGADKVTTGAYTVTVTRVSRSFSTNTTLHILTLTYDHDADNAATTPDRVQTVPGFASGRAPASNYTAPVPNVVGTVVVTATASHTDAVVVATLGADEDSATAITDSGTAGDNAFVSGDVTLSDEGQDTVIRITVTAHDGVSKATYKVTVARAASPTSTISTLSALSLMAGGNDVTIVDSDTANAFAVGDCTTANACTARVSSSTTSVTVMATPTNRDAAYVVKSNKDSSVQRGVVDLVEGANEIEVRVTAAAGPSTPDDTTDDCAATSPDTNITCYTVMVTRALGTEPRTTTLSVLSFTEQGDTPPTASAFMPSFAPDDAPASGGYTAYAAAAEDNVVLTATASHSGASVTVRSGADEEAAMDASTIDASGGTFTVPLTAPSETPAEKTDTVILVTVTASDQVTSQTYKLMVVRGAAGSDDRNLSALSITADGDAVVLTPAFVATSGNTAYAGTARVPNSTTMVEVMATPEDARNGATYAVTSDEDRNVQNNQVDLSEGANVIKVTVTGADKVSTLEHMVTVTRVASNLSTDTTLSALSLVDNNAARSRSGS